MTTRLSWLSDFRLGDHVCLPIDDDAAALMQTARLVSAGLRQRQRIIVFTNTASATIRQGLAAAVPDLSRAIEQGQLVLRSPWDLPLAGGRFDPTRAMAGFAEAIESARYDGYPGVWLSIDMSWALENVPGVERVFDFEAALNPLFAERGLAAVCQYDSRVFLPQAIASACAAHPTTAGQARLRFRRTRRPPGLALSGQCDLTNRNAVQALLSAMITANQTIDLREVDFVDIGAVRLIYEVAATVPDRRVTLVCRPPLAALLRLLDIDRVANVVLAAGRRVDQRDGQSEQ